MGRASGPPPNGNGHGATEAELRRRYTEGWGQ